MNKDTPLENLLFHLDHMIEHLGENHVGFDSDFDGAYIPRGIQDASDLAGCE